MKILSIDGGGIRGVIPALILQEIEKRSGEPIGKLFDLIAGTSTGGLIALGLALDNGHGSPKYTASDLVDLYMNRGDEIFDRDVWQRIRSLGNIADEKYPNENLQKIVKEYFGEKTLKDTICDVIIPAYETERRMPWFFKSLHAKNPSKEGYDFLLSDVALSTSAAPTYFQPHKIELNDNDYLSMIDGGVYANNPSMCALIDAKAYFQPKDSDITMLSLGTGQTTRSLDYDKIKDWGLLKWAQPVLDCVFDGVSDTIQYQVHRLLPEGNSFRLQTELNNSNDDMDDTSAHNLRKLRLDAEKIIYENSKAIDQVIDRVCNS